MTILLSSAEFELNSNFVHTLFGEPHFFENGQFIYNSGYKTKGVSFESGDIDKLDTWIENKEQIKSLYLPGSSFIRKDVNNQLWISIGWTGGGQMWSVGLGSIESGKYKI